MPVEVGVEVAGLEVVVAGVDGEMKAHQMRSAVRASA